jgi:ankyrin repeat protein
MRDNEDLDADLSNNASIDSVSIRPSESSPHRQSHYSRLPMLLRISSAAYRRQSSSRLETRGKALKEALSYGHKDIVLLLARGFDAQVHREAYGSALAEACRRKQRHIVRILIVEGADVNSRNSRYNTSILETACWSGDVGIVWILLQSGANPDGQALIPDGSLRAAWESGDGDLLKQTLSNIFEERRVKQRKRRRNMFIPHPRPRLVQPQKSDIL